MFWTKPVVATLAFTAGVFACWGAGKIGERIQDYQDEKRLREEQKEYKNEK